jgi:small-conductance mechanosensitive channel
VNSFATVVETYDGRVVHVPNAEVLANPIVNRSAAGGLRLEIEVRATTTGQPTEVLDTIREVTAGAAGVLSTPAPLVSLRAAEPGRLTAYVRAWHDPASDGPSVAGTVVEDPTVASPSSTSTPPSSRRLRLRPSRPKHPSDHGGKATTPTPTNASASRRRGCVHRAVVYR